MPTMRAFSDHGVNPYARTPAKSIQSGKNTRRFSLAALPPIRDAQTADQRSQIEKSAVNSRKRRALDRPDVVQKFEECMDSRRADITQWVNENLNFTLDSFNSDIGQITEDFTKCFKRVVRIEEELKASLADVELEVDLKSSDLERSPSVQTEHVILGDRMKEFQKIVPLEANNLKQLWQEWNEIQLQVTSLAIEVFGLDAFPPLEGHQNIGNAIDANEVVCQQYESAKNNIADIEKTLKKITQQTIQMATEQEKEWKLAKSKSFAAVEKALQNLEDTL